MALTSALYTGLSGLNANQTRIDTIGNNIANVNTTAFKGSRTLFQSQFYETLNHGSSPSEATGGNNPTQIGHGVLAGATQTNFQSGPVETTGLIGDLAIEGAGFFIVDTPAGPAYTRDGSFSLDANNELVSVDGYRVQGFTADASGAVNTGQLAAISVPLGAESLARATGSVSLDGHLSADGVAGTNSPQSLTQALIAGGGAPAVDATALVDLRAAAGGAALFADGDEITVAGVTKGGRELPAQTFVVGTDGSTLGDYAAWLRDTLGIQDTAGLPGDPGVFVEGGALAVRSNAGAANDIVIGPTDIISSSNITSVPFRFSQTNSATGESVHTGFTVFDSLGAPVQVNVTFALEAKTAQGPQWRFYVESDEAEGARALGTGTLSFDVNGNVRDVQGAQINIDRGASGAASPLSFMLDFSQMHGLATASSTAVAASQDGYPPGTLTGYNVEQDGSVVGTFSNGIDLTLGQVALASFRNPAGMVAERENLYRAGPNSGAPAVVTPGQFGAGLVRGGALEMSNVDLGREFIGLVTASTGFQASSRVISVSSDMLNQLMLIVR